MPDELIQSPQAAVDYFQPAVSGACGSASCSYQAQFGPQTVQAIFHGFTARTAYGNALRPAGAPGPIGFTIHVIDGAACRLARPRLAWRADDFGEKRIVPGWSGGGKTTYFLRSENGIAVADWPARRAFVWLPSWQAVSWHERAAPFRWLFDGLAERLGMSTLHGAAIGLEGRGVLVAGRGGIGKSTLALACLGAGLDYAGDDYCLLDGGAAPQAHALYSTAKWKKDAAVVPAWLNAVAADAVDRTEHKNILFVDRTRPEQLADRLSIEAIVVPAITGLASSFLQPITAQEALANLAASTIAQSEADGAVLVRAIAGLARMVPAFRLHMSGDPDSSVAVIRSLLAGIAAEDRQTS